MSFDFPAVQHQDAPLALLLDPPAGKPPPAPPPRRSPPQLLRPAALGHDLRHLPQPAPLGRRSRLLRRRLAPHRCHAHWKRDRMTRIATAFAILLAVIVKLTAPAIAPSISQACWNERKRSEEHTSELQSLMRNSYAVSCL